MYYIVLILFLIILILVPYFFLAFIKRLFSNKSNIKKTISFNIPLGQVKVSNTSENINNNENYNIYSNVEKFNDKYGNIKGNTKITNKINKKVIKYQNGVKISEENTETVNNFEKEAMQKCENCGASIDIDNDICTYCRTPIN